MDNLQHARFVISRTENPAHDADIASIIVEATGHGYTISVSTIKAQEWEYTEILVTNEGIFI